MDINSLLSPSDDYSSPANPSASPRPSSHAAFIDTNSNSPVHSGHTSNTTPTSNPRQSPFKANEASTSKSFSASGMGGPSEEVRDEIMTGGDYDDGGDVSAAAVAVRDGTGAAHEAIMEDASDGDENEVAAAPPVPLSEEDYTRIADLLVSITNRPYQYESHVEYISLLRRGFLVHQAGPREAGPYPLIKDLRKAREDMIERFPLNETMWAEWIADEISICGGLEERLGVMELCAKAVEEESASVKLWKTYAEYIESQYSLGRGGDAVGKGKAKKVALSQEEEITLKGCFTLELVVETYRLGSLATKDNIAESHVLWNKYRDLMMMDLEATPTAPKIEFIRKLYVARLQIPHTAISDTFSEFSTFITRYDNANYESVMVSTNKLYAAALAKYNERSMYEDRLAKRGQVSLAEEWNAWAEYLEWETSQPKKKLDVDMACALYERCLLCFGEQARVWEEYVFFTLEKQLGPRVNALLKRATRHCPWSGTLWAQYIIALERAYRPFEEVSEIKHRATTTGMLDLGGLEEVLKVNITWCGFLKRRAFEHDAGEDDFDMAEMGISEAVTETGKKDPEYRLQRIHINFCTLAKKIDAAREIWKELAKTQGDSYEYWLRYYHWEISHGPKDKDYAGSALKAALRRNTLDWPEKILETWKNHVEDFGNVEDVEYATVRYRKLSKEILERRAQEAQVAALQQQQTMKDQQHEADTPQTDESARASSKRRRSVAEADDSQPKKKSKAVETLAAEKPAAHSLPSASSAAKRDRENTTVIVKNLPPNYPEVRVRQFFRDCGTINSLKLIVEKDGKTSTATVEFENREDVLTAQTKNLKIIDGHSIEVQVGTGSTLYVTNFPPTADEAYIRDLFKDCGEIADIRFPSLKYNTHRRFCYVQFASSDEAHKATSLHGKQLGGKETLVAKISAPDQKHERSGAVYEGREVYIRNIDFQAHDNDVQELFQKYGKIEKVRLPPGPKKGTHKGYGFVTFSTKEEALAAVEGANNTQLKSRTLIVSIADPNPSKKKPTNANSSTEKTRASTPGRNTDPTRQKSLDPANPTSPQQPSAPAFSDIKKKTLGIMNLSDTINDTKIRQMFEKYGPLRKVTLRPDHQGAIVEFENVADAGKATLALDGSELAGRKIKIGGLADLMRQSPERKVTKGFLPANHNNNGDSKKGGAVLFRPSQVGGGGMKGQKRRAGLGFTGAVKKKEGDADADLGKKAGKDTEMTDGPPVREAPKAKSNADFKAMFLRK